MCKRVLIRKILRATACLINSWNYFHEVVVGSGGWKKRTGLSEIFSFQTDVGPSLLTVSIYLLRFFQRIKRSQQFHARWRCSADGAVVHDVRHVWRRGLLLCGMR